MSPLAKHHFVASNRLPASHRFSGPLLAVLIWRMEQKITLATYESANTSPTMKLQQNLASTVREAQAVQWLCSITHRRRRLTFSATSRRAMGHSQSPNEWVKLNNTPRLRWSCGSATVGEAEHYAKDTVELFHLYACNTLTFTRYNKTTIQQTSLQSIT